MAAVATARFRHPSHPDPDPHARLEILGAASLIGRTLSIDEWAKLVPIPDRKNPGRFLAGEDINRITGIERKSWDPDLFRDFDRIVDVGREALESADVSPAEVDSIVVGSTMPYMAHLDADAYRIARTLHIPDHVAPIQLHTGCAGLARAVSLVRRLRGRHTLIIGYQVSSLYLTTPLYIEGNEHHPYADGLWYSPAFFSDGAAAIVLRHDDDADGCAFYSRDALSFGQDPGFHDPLVHCPGGGALYPPGTTGSEELACAGMSAQATKEYYAKGMMLNHETLERHRPRYLEHIARLYPHQASPRLIDGFMDELCSKTSVRPETIANSTRRYGNMVIPSTMTLFSEDLSAGRITSGDLVCFSVVGSGPERGAFILPIA